MDETEKSEYLSLKYVAPCRSGEFLKFFCLWISPGAPTDDGGVENLFWGRDGASSAEAPRVRSPMRPIAVCLA